MQNPQQPDLDRPGNDRAGSGATIVIIEMATIVTDSDLNVLAEGPVMAVHHGDAVLAGMDEWNTRTHGESGLTQRVRESTIDSAAGRGA